MPTRVALIGFGKIASDQHVPAIAADRRFALAAVATRTGDPKLGIPWFREPAELYAAMRGKIDAVAICTPPLVRHAIAREALRAGYDVLLEKPPAATLGEIEDLERLARETGQVLHASWHSQHAPGVPAAAAALAGAEIARLHISWREDVRKWHPGQQWIWEAGGFGVFDPGINALSIVTRILPVPLFVRDATLYVPANKQAPIAATLRFAGEAMTAEMDWRYEHGEEWTITVDTRGGRRIELRDGGARLMIDGASQEVVHRGEYPAIYAHFAELRAERRSEVDRAPLRIVADAFLVGRRESVEPFD